MRYAQIKNGNIANVIILEDLSLKSLFGSESGYDAFVRVDQLNPEPGIGWAYDYDSGHFSLVVENDG